MRRGAKLRPMIKAGGWIKGDTSPSQRFIGGLAKETAVLAAELAYALIADFIRCIRCISPIYQHSLSRCLHSKLESIFRKRISRRSSLASINSCASDAAGSAQPWKGKQL